MFVVCVCIFMRVVLYILSIHVFKTHAQPCQSVLLMLLDWGVTAMAAGTSRKEMGTLADCGRKPSWLYLSSPTPMWPQDRETGQRDHEGNGGPSHRGPLCAQRGLQVLCRPAGLHQGPEQEQWPLHPHDSGLHSPKELLCKLSLFPLPLLIVLQVNPCRGLSLFSAQTALYHCNKYSSVLPLPAFQSEQNSDMTPVWGFPLHKVS